MTSDCFLVLDPFADAAADTSDSKGVQSGHIHIRIQQRNGRKTLTTVQGISDDYDKKKLVRYAKRVSHRLVDVFKYKVFTRILRVFVTIGSVSDGR